MEPGSRSISIMMKKKEKISVPDLTEFTDEEGKKWIQTSTEDLLSMRELNEIIESLDRDKSKDDLVLARINFQNVNREYYHAAVALQEKLSRQGELLKKIATESKKTIEKKNRKLKELIEYIKKLHLFLAYINTNADDLDKIKIPAAMMMQAVQEKEPELESEYEEVEEKIL